MQPRDDSSLAMNESTGGDGRLHLALRGCLDIASAPRLEARLRQLENTARRVELDVEQVTFIDLRGLSAIHASLMRAGRGPLLLEVRPRVGACVGRLLELTGTELWPIPQPRAASLRVAAAGRPAMMQSLPPPTARMLRRC